MAGRRRKSGKREPNGRVQRTYRPDHGTPEAAFKRQAAVGNADPILSVTSIGIMHARMPNEITRAMMDAGFQYAWLRYSCFGKPFAKASAYAECIHEHLTSEDRLPVTTNEDVRWKYIRADDVVKSVSRQCRHETYSVCVEDRLPSWFRRRQSLVVRKSDFSAQWSLRAGLEVLQEHFGIED